MSPSNVKAGMNYEIRVTENVTKTLDAIEARIETLQKKAASISLAGDAKSKQALDQVSNAYKKQEDAVKRTNKAKEDGAKEDQRSYRFSQQQLRNAQYMNLQRDRLLSLSKEMNITHTEAAKQLGITRTRAQAFGIELQKADGIARRMLFTFRRLVGILAIFTLARKFSQYIGSAVNEMSRFNASLEGSQIAFSALITAVGDIVDENGKLLNTQEEYNAAVELSREIMTDLRKDALGTVATFEDLTKAFQVAIGPGLSAGLGLDEVRKTAVDIAKAATALQVPTDQLSEEIRSLIQGTIRLNNTRLAAIGVTNDEIRLAREQGNLYEYLAGKLEAFAIATEDVQRTYEGLQSQIRDAFSSLLAEGSKEYFEELKISMQGLVDTLIDVEEIGGGKFGVDPLALEAVREFSEGLAEVIRDFRELVQAQGILQDIHAILESIGTTLKVISTGLAPIAVGLIKALAAVAKMFSLVNNILISLKRDTSVSKIVKAVQFIATSMIAIVTATAIWRGIIALVTSTFKKFIPLQIMADAWQAALNTKFVITAAIQDVINGKMTIMQGILTAINLLIGNWLAVLAAVLAAVGLTVVQFKALSKATEDISGDMEGILKDSEDYTKQMKAATDAVIGQSNALNKLRERNREIVDEIKEVKGKVRVESLLQGLVDESRAIQEGVYEALTGYDKEVQDAQSEIERYRKSIIDLNQEMENEASTIRELEAIRKNLNEQYPYAKERFYGKREAGGGFVFPADTSPQVSKAVRLIDETQAKLNKAYKERSDRQSKINKNTEQEKRLTEELMQTIAEKVELVKQEGVLRELQISNIDSEKRAYAALIRLVEQVQELNLLGWTRAEAGLAGYELQLNKVDKEIQNLVAAKEQLSAPITLEIDGEQQAVTREEFYRRLKLSDADIQKRLLEEQKALNMQEQAIAAKRLEAVYLERQILEQRAIVNNELVTSFQFGLERWVSNVENFAQSFRELGETLPEEFSNTVANTIVDAVRGEDVDVDQVAADFLAQILRQMISTLINNLISLILSNTLLQNSLSSTTVSLTTAMGTLTTAVGGLEHTIWATAWSRNGGGAVGFDKGGHVKGDHNFPKPSYIHPRDTVRAWLTPGEHVMTTKAVHMYGRDFFDSLNASARSYATIGSRVASSRAISPVIGRAAGGSVPGGTVSTPQRTMGGELLVVQPVMVADEAVAEQIFSGGRDAFAEQSRKSRADVEDFNRSSV